ncbi:DNA Pol III Epsilon Chain [hydrothermal vent metagenome]|uniref:DNA Pol III Epsilon Chain n=1 Tax=hydrothermal vent metagenome TaxID=652676 RepID=A0A3B0UQT1_9ZZZZ
MELNLKRPLAFFDIESTGLNVSKDRIIELCIIKVNPNGTTETKTWLLNPDYPISEEAEKIHGISQESVKDKPTFKQVAKDIYRFLTNCDLAGYNSNRFDIPMLVEEFLRADVDFEVENRHFIDVQNIFMKMEQRTLKAAYRFYLQKELENAHSAEADVTATYEVLKAQLDRYADTAFTDKEGQTGTPVVNDMEALAKFSTHHRNADLMGQIIYNAKDEEVINFGKHKGKTVEEVFRKEPSYYDWMQKADFPLYTKKLLTKIKLRMAGK